MSARAYSVSEISARSPDMNDREFAEFVEDIRRNGQLVPIWVLGDEVIDGRKRLAACERLGITPLVVNMDPSQDAESVARALNVLRTHYSPSQRAIFAAERATATPADGRRMHRSSPTKNSGAPVTIEQAATEVGVSPSYVIAAKYVKREAAPEVVKAMKSGELTLHAAKEIVRSVPKEEQPEITARVIESSQGKSRHTPVAKVLEGVDPRRDRAQPKPVHEQFVRAVQSMEVLAPMLETYAAEASSDTRRYALITSLRDIRTAITRAINIMEARK